MIAPRWRKVLADLWGNKVRSTLMAVTIAVGIFAVGFIAAIGDICMSDMDSDFAAANGHSAILYTDPFGDDLVKSLRSVPGVANVEGRSAVSARAIVTENDKRSMQIVAIPPLDEMQIDRLRSLDDQPLPALNRHEIYLADSALGVLAVQPGDMVTIELSDGRTRELRVVAIAHDVYAIPASMGSAIMAYSDLETIEWLGGTSSYNQVYMTVQENGTDKAHVAAVSQTVADKIQASGREVYFTFIYNPGRHFAKDIFQAVTAVLAILGALSVLLSTFLIINIITALLNQHIRFIGVMKAMGGRQSQIMVMYLTLVACFGLIALALTVGTAGLAGYSVSKGMGSYLNFAVGSFRFSTPAIILQVSIALAVPVLAAIGPVWNGTRLTVREAISNYGLGKGRFGKSRIDRVLEQIRFFSRPTLISIRNTFRRKLRLILTLSTLTLAGAIFISVFNLWTAFDQVITQIQGYFLADVNIDLARNYRLSKIQALAEDLPEVTSIEGWAFQTAELYSQDKSATVQIALVAPPNQTQLIKPILTAGRWLVPSDENAVVIGNHVLRDFPNLQVGDTIVTRINDMDYSWTIVGIYKMAGNANPALIYTNYDYLTQRINQVGQVATLRVITTSSSPYTQEKAAQELETVFQHHDIQVSQITTGDLWSRQQSGQFDVMIYFLLVMAVLIAVVGGLGLMGTMSMNVLERSREIGVLRAIGASNLAIMRLVMVEGLLIGWLSWGLGLLVSVPITFGLNAGVGASILTVPLDFTFGLNGILIWLGLVTVIAAFASILPAWNAMRLTIREVLAYE